MTRKKSIPYIEFEVDGGVRYLYAFASILGITFTYTSMLGNPGKTKGRWRVNFNKFDEKEWNMLLQSSETSNLGNLKDRVKEHIDLFYGVCEW